MADSRRRFTELDDKRLLEYLAVAQPGSQGRSGNLIYRALVDNEKGEWPWSSTRTWGAWRDRYAKRRDYFDAKIRQYQKKNALPTHNDGAVAGSWSQQPPDEVANEKKRKRKRDSEGRKDKDKRPKVEKEENRAPKKVLRKEEEEESPPGESVKRETKVTVHSKTLPKDLPVKKAHPDVPKVVNQTQVKEGSETEGEDEDEDERGPINSDDYGGEVFKFEEDEAVDQLQDDDSAVEEEDTKEVDQMLTDAQDSGTERKSNTPIPLAHGGDQLYPDIATLPSPNLKKEIMPGGFVESKRLSNPQPSQEPTPPVSGADDLKVARPPPSTRRSTQAAEPSPTAVAKKRVFIKRKSPAVEDVFGTPALPDPTRTPSPSPSNKRRPPILIEGPYGNSFVKRPRHILSDTEESDTAPKILTWPPVRGKHAVVAKGKQGNDPPTVVQNTLDKGKGKEKEKVVNAAAPESEPKLSVVKSRPRPQVNAVASSSRVISNPSSSMKRGVDEIVPSETIHSSLNQVYPPVTAEENREQENKLPVPTLERQGVSIDKTAAHMDSAMRQVNPQPPGEVLSKAKSSKSDKKASVNIATAFLPPILQDSSPSTNPFVSISAPPVQKSGSSKEERRATIGNAPVPKGPLIDLRREMVNRRSSSIRNGQSFSSSSSRTRQSVSRRNSPTESIVLPQEEQDMIINRMITAYSQQYGFTEDLIRRSFQLLKSLVKTEELLQSMKEKADEEAQRILSESIIEPESRQASPERLREEPQPASGSGSRRLSKKLDFRIRQILDDEHDSEYTPPNSSRAGRYTRLKQMGREEEAREREVHRVSRAALSPLMDCEPDTPCPPSSQGNRTPSKDNDGTKHSRESSISNPEAAMDVDEPTPVVYLEWNADREALFSSVHSKNAEEVREVESKVDPQVLLQWMMSCHSVFADKYSSAKP